MVLAIEKRLTSLPSQSRRIICLHTVKWSNKSISKIQFSIRHLLAHSVDVKQFYLTQEVDPIRSKHSRPEWTWEQWQWRGTPQSPKHQYYWSITIRWLNVIIRTLVRGVLTLHRDAVVERYFGYLIRDFRQWLLSNNLSFNFSFANWKS